MSGWAAWRDIDHERHRFGFAVWRTGCEVSIGRRLYRFRWGGRPMSDAAPKILQCRARCTGERSFWKPRCTRWRWHRGPHHDHGMYAGWAR